MNCYRVDERDFKIGELIEPRYDEFIRESDSKKEIKQKVEKLLENYRDKNKPCRTQVLMLFSNLERAKRHWSLISNSKLYQVEIDPQSIIHIGDYEKIEELYKIIGKASFDKNYAKSIALDYWAGNNIKEPELFVMSSKVTKILGIESDRINFLKNRLGITPFTRDID